MTYKEFELLDKINSLRNRVAHHEPICFNSAHSIASTYAMGHYQQIIDLVTYMGIDAQILFYSVDDVLSETVYLSRLAA